MNNFVFFTFVHILFIALSSVLSAQPTVADIKLSGNYHWGEGISLEKSSAEELARQNLVNRIVVVVSSEQTQTEQEIGSEYASEFRSRTRATSRLQLRGLQYHSEQRRDRSWLVIAYIPIVTFNESLRTDEQQILSKLSEAHELTRTGLFQRAIPRYKEVYLSTFFHPAPIYTNEEEHGRKALARGYAQSRLTDWMRGLDVQVSGVRSRSTGDNIELYVDVQVTDGGRSVDQLLVRINRTGYGSHRVTSGSASIYVDQAPDTRIHPLELELRLNPALLDDEALQELALDVGPTITRIVPVDYSPVIQLDMRASSMRGNQLTVTPLISNLSVFSLEWQLSDGGVSRDPVLTYFVDTSQSNQTITLVVNNSEELSVSRMVGEEGQLLPVVPTGGRGTVAGRTITSPGTDRSPVVGGSSARETQSATTDTQIGNAGSGASGGAASQGGGIASDPVTTPSVEVGGTGSGARPVPGRSATSTGGIDAVPSSHSQYLQHIIRIRNAEQLTAHFTQLQSRDLLMFGQRSSVADPDRSYLAIIDQTSREVVTIVTPVNNGQRRNLRTNEAFDVSAMAEQFRGLGAIWFQFK